jgi:hypothetical protein
MPKQSEKVEKKETKLNRTELFDTHFKEFPTVELYSEKDLDGGAEIMLCCDSANILSNEDVRGAAIDYLKDKYHLANFGFNKDQAMVVKCDGAHKAARYIKLVATI